MPKNKHTPGPWKVWTARRSKDIEIQHNGKVPIVKWSGFDESFRKHSEHLANARLLAASPELLTACEEALEWLRHHGGDALPKNEPGLMALIANLEAAIDKAK